MSDAAEKARNHLSNCEHYALAAAGRLHVLRYSGDEQRDELIADIMHGLLIIAEEARQGLKRAAKGEQG